MIHTFSRYYTGPLAQEDEAVYVLREPATEVEIQLYGYVWKDGDRIDDLAAKFLGDPYSWWRIMDANPSIQDPWGIEVGTAIRIPKNA